tara:strand:- start:684 stop:1418 length:735 start_codon:yes stop_codon:yes gene_type:complete
MSYLINKKNQKIAYNSKKGRSPGLVFIHGLNSDKEGIKAKNIEKYAKKNNLSFVRFDCRGHGSSFGKFNEFTLTDWKQDLIDVIDNLTKGPQILIGSSMGGWLMILAAKSRPKRIFGLIGLAAAIDFGKDLFNDLNRKNQNEIKLKGATKYNSNGFSYTLTKKFFIEAKKNNILNKSFNYSKPMILVHGIKDKVVNSDMPKKIMKLVKGNNVQIVYLKSSDHRLSKTNDLKVINNTIDNIRKLT